MKPKAGDLKLTVHAAPEPTESLLDRGMTAAQASAELTRKCVEYQTACSAHYSAMASEGVSRLFGEVVDAAKVLGYWAAREERAKDKPPCLCNGTRRVVVARSLVGPHLYGPCPYCFED